jgi:hypothetical protein
MSTALGAALALAAIAAGAQILKPAPGPALDLARLLPAGGEAKGWTAAGDPQIFKGEDLFLYINGGAEVYQEYGFRRVIAQEYKGAGGKTISLEIYEMADPAAAFGMFTFKSSARGKPAELGQGGRIEDYYLNFWKGPCLVTITAFDESAECRAGLEPLAKAADARIVAKGVRPAIVDAIPKEWAETGRVIYLEGVIGLNNVHVFHPTDVFRFREAAAVEQASFTAFLFGYGNAAESAGRLDAIRKAFASSPLYKEVRAAKEGGFDALDAKSGRLAARLRGGRIALVRVPAGAPAGTDPAAILEKLK